MPNWCMNTLEVKGSESDVQDFVKKAKSENTALSFNNFVTMPEELNEGDGWYAWDLENWGTKWDTSDAWCDKYSDNYIEYYFDTAWSPPIEWLEKVSQMYPKIEFTLRYREDGMAFGGKAFAMNGELDDTEVDLSVVYQDMIKEGLKPEGDSFYDEYEQRVSNFISSL